jgi:putative Holliday junction resolvase
VRALGVDYGRRRTGLALSDVSGLIARPWKTITCAGGPVRLADALLAEIASLRNEEGGLGAIVLGLPRRLSGEPNEQTAAVETLAAHLRALLEHTPVVLQDERLTSREAESLIARREKNWRRRRPLVDAMAAAIILQDYLDAQARESRREDVNQ